MKSDAETREGATGDSRGKQQTRNLGFVGIQNKFDGGKKIDKEYTSARTVLCKLSTLVTQ